MMNEVLEKLNQMIGLFEIKEMFKKIISMGSVGSMENIILTGNPGTGKTTVAKLIGQLFYEMGYLESGHVVETDRSQLVAGYVGQTAILTRQKVEEAMGGVLFIDEAYTLKREGQSGNDFGQEAIDTLCKLMDQYKGKFIVVAAGHPKEMEVFMKSNPGLQRRFTALHIADYNPEEMLEILKFHASKERVCFSKDLESKLPDFCENWVNLSGEQWGNAGEAVKLIESMVRSWKNDKEKETVTDDHGMEYSVLKTEYIPDELKENLKPVAKTSAIDDINKLIGFREIKDELQKLLDLKEAAQNGNEDLLNDLNFHWVLRGNPGTGKTTVAKLIGKVYKEMELLSSGHTVKVTRKDLVAEYVGHTAPKTQQCIDRAMGGVLFIDEAYTLKREEQSGNDFGQEAIDALLEQMSEKNGDFAVIAAGYPDEMEVFVNSNPGFCSRFAQDFTLSDYSADELLQIFILKCKEKQFYLEEDFKSIIRQMFENMISAKRKGWANGREAENLERSMRPLWAKNQVNCIDSASGETHRCYTIDHIPESYRKYLFPVNNKMSRTRRMFFKRRKNRQ